MTDSTFSQVDVFTAEPFAGNPVAVIHDADHLSTEQMQRIANWTNLSETTFLLKPTELAADYRLRIFTPDVELPFAGHPTIGSCHGWLAAGGEPRAHGVIVQECELGLIELRLSNDRLAFAAPPLIKGGPVTEPELAPVLSVLQLDRKDIIDAQWADNGPGWLAVRLASAEQVLALQPDFGAVDSYDIGVVGPYPVGVAGPHPVSDSPDAIALEVRAFFRAGGVPAEDPVTGSLNAALAQWLLAEANPIVGTSYVAAQGTAIGRAGRIYVDKIGDSIWIGGDAVTCVTGTIRVP